MADQKQEDPVKVKINGKEYRLCPTCDILYPEELAREAEKEAKKLTEGGERHFAILLMLRACPLCAAKEFCRTVGFSQSTRALD